MEIQSKPRVELRLKVKILNKISDWDKDSGWAHKKNGLITLGHHTAPFSSLAKQSKQEHRKHTRGSGHRRFHNSQEELYEAQGLIFRLDRIVLPKKLQRKMIKVAHEMDNLERQRQTKCFVLNTGSRP